MALRTLYGLSICAGIGGIDLGLRLALGQRYRTALYIEREIAAAAILAARMQDKSLCDAPIWSDVWTFDAGPWQGRIDIVTAGIPCQPWSIAGRQRGHQDTRHLWVPTYKILEQLRPTFFFLENVPGLSSGGGLEPIFNDLQALGYNVEGGVFSAAEVGAPHVRKRIFVLAYVANATSKQRWTLQKLKTQATIHTTNRRSNVATTPSTWLDANRQNNGATIAKMDGALNGFSGVVGRHPWRDGWEANEPRVTYGTANRVDMLRALGNAVVPQTAAHAFTTLLAQTHCT